LTILQRETLSEDELDSPSGNAEEKMIQVMKSDTPGSKYSVHLPSKNQMTRPAAITPTFPRLDS
jgi:hypothetical protein